MTSPGGDRAPTSRLVGIASFCALWCLAFLTGSPLSAYLAVPLVFVAMLLLRSHPIAGGLTAVIANLVTLAAGVPYGSVDMMAAFAFALFSVGRAVRSLTVGVTITALAAITTAVRPPFEPLDLLVGVGVFGSMWLFGRLVRRRARRAWHAVRIHEQLVAKDPSAFTELHLAEERHRLANQALVALRAAVTDMHRLADEGIHRQRSDAGSTIQQRGTAAVAELRTLLGLLREPGTTSPEQREPAVGRVPAISPLWWALLGVALAATFVGIIVVPEDPEALLPLAAVYAAIAWRVATGAQTKAWFALAVLAVAATVLASNYGFEGAGFMFVVFVMPVLTGHVWGERDRITERALHDSAVLQQQREMSAAEALRAERLRIARDLHDVTSHAVGVMVLQAGAAHALSNASPERAMTALRQVRTAGDDALVEIDQLLRVMDVEAAPHDLASSLADLCEQMRGLGLRVELRALALPEGDSSGQTIHQVVREGLTNVLRHAPGARVLVEVDRSAGEWLIRVANDRPPLDEPSQRGSGYGLTGMTERVADLGGSLTSGPRPSGGFLIEARLPARD